MKLRFLNKTIQHRQFDYSPLYFDERKDRLNKKKELYSKLETGELSEDDRREMLRNSIREEWSRTEHRKELNKKANIRILLLIALILILGYFIFNGVDQVDTVVKKLW